MDRTMSRRALCAVAVVGIAWLTACGGGDDPGPQPAAGPCAALRDTCLSRQLACVEAGAEARCEACPEGQYAAPTGACEAIGGTPMSHEFSEFTVQPGEEILGLCQSWTLGNPEEIWVNAVELFQDEASHHSNWTFVPADQYDGPDGVWPCDERGYTQVVAALSGGVLYAQSTQAESEVQRFPNGAAVRIPPYARIIGDVHLLNTAPAPVTGSARLTLYALAPDEVQVKLVPFHLTYEGLDLPPRATSRFKGECALNDRFLAAGSVPFGMDIYYLLPHHHALGTRFFLEVLGGPEAGRSLFDVQGFDSEPHGRAYDPPLSVKGAEGLTFGCDFDNPRDEGVGWGFGDQEMCEVLGFADSKVAFESSVDSAAAAGADGEVQQFTGPCNTLAFPWNHDKEGGPPPG